MKLGLITQIRNEIDILQPFLRHIDGLFDVVHVIDHQSVDGTTQVLKEAVSQRPSWNYYFLEIKTKVQAEVSNFMLRKAFEDDLDYLFFLDADEFINVTSRQDLENRLSKWTDPSTAGVLTWKNCICGDFHQKEFTRQTPLWVPQTVSTYFKLILSRAMYENYDKQVTVSEGNHIVSNSLGVEIPTTPIGTLLHVPIRSQAQAENKVILTAISYRGYKERKPGNSFQYNEMLEKIAEGKVSEDDVRGFTIGFERPHIVNTAVSEEELLRRGYTSTTLQDLRVASSENLQITPQTVNPGFARRVAGALNKLEENFIPNSPLVLEDGVLRVDSELLKRRTVKAPRVPQEDTAFQSLSARLDEQNRVIRALSAQTEQLSIELEKVNNEILSYAQSNSWKLTRPLRKLFRKFRGSGNV